MASHGIPQSTANRPGCDRLMGEKFCGDRFRPGEPGERSAGERDLDGALVEGLERPNRGPGGRRGPRGDFRDLGARGAGRLQGGSAPAHAGKGSHAAAPARHRGQMSPTKHAAPSQAPKHRPVLLAEVMRLLAPRDGGIYVDGTYGAGGYSHAILESADCRVWGIDRDPSAVAAGTTC